MKTSFQRCISVLLALLATVLCASAQTSGTTYFLKLDGIPGESKAAGHAGEIDVVSFNLGVQQRRVSDFGGGAAAAKSTFMPLVIHKQVDAATPKLFLACAKGEHIPKAQFIARKEGAQPFEYLVITLTDVVISSVQHVSAERDGDPLFMESISLNYSKIEMKYTPQKADGSADSPVVGTYDVKKNRSF